MPRSFAIGDIHGCRNTLYRLLFDVLHTEPGDTLYFLGDYIDRGPDSKGVIDLIHSLQQQGCHTVTLRGNHEQLMMDSGHSEEHFALWIRNGGNTTLESFGITSYAKMPERYKTFFASTRLYAETDTHILVHAGLNFTEDDIFSDARAMLWIRQFEVDTIKTGGRILVHGHTLKPLDHILSQKNTPAVNLDAGCVYKEIPGFGALVALELHTHRFFFVPYGDTDSGLY